MPYRKFRLLVLAALGATVSAVQAAPLVERFAGAAEAGYAGDDGPALEARFDRPSGLAWDKDGNLYIADRENHRIRKVASNGIITTIAGTGAEGFSGDGGPATKAQLSYPRDVAIEETATGQRLYILDQWRVRVVYEDGIIQTLAGGGSSLVLPTQEPTDFWLGTGRSIALHPNGVLVSVPYVHHRVLRISDGQITAFAGNGEQGAGPPDYGDGGRALDASFWSPRGLAVDAEGNTYIADWYWVLRVDSKGIITIFAGSTQSGDLGDGGQAIDAVIGGVDDIAVSADKKVFIDDSNHSRIRQVDATGQITTLAGGGSSVEPCDPYEASYCEPDEARLNAEHLTLEPWTGAIYATETWEHGVVKIGEPPGPIFYAFPEPETKLVYAFPEPQQGLTADDQTPVEIEREVVVANRSAQNLVVKWSIDTNGDQLAADPNPLPGTEVTIEPKRSKRFSYKHYVSSNDPRVLEHYVTFNTNDMLRQDVERINRRIVVTDKPKLRELSLLEMLLKLKDKYVPSGADLYTWSATAAAVSDCTETFDLVVDHSQPQSGETVLPDSLGGGSLVVTDIVGTATVGLKPSGDPNLCDLAIDSGELKAESVDLPMGYPSGANTVILDRQTEPSGTLDLTTGSYSVDASGTLFNDAFPNGIRINSHYQGVLDVTTGQVSVETDTTDTILVLNTLFVTADGSGSGTVWSEDGNIQCGNVCRQGYETGAVVRLIAQASGGSYFDGWNPSACSARFSMPANDRICVATFEAIPVAQCRETGPLEIAHGVLSGINAYQSEHDLTTDGAVRVASDAIIDFAAAQGIRLESGFEAELGARFTARVAPVMCGGD